MPNSNRRHFLKSTAAALTALSCASLRADENIYAPFKVGIATYTFRNFKTLDEVLAKLKELGLKYSEFNKAHLVVTSDPKKIAEYKEKLAAAGVTPLAICVYTFAENPGANRAVFEFAKAMNVPTISATFTKKGALSLDKLCEEFPDIRVGIHNHGMKDIYKSPDDVLECVKDRHKNIGATADLGHYIGSKQDPLECIEKLKDRLYGIHFKDYKIVDGKDVETIVGDGVLKVKETLALLKKVNFQGCLSLEYEQKPENPVPDLKIALERIQKAAREI
ncbi:MAG TPA: sugar phosphate isomerase/epimerase [Planctomycetota bacterium]|nr:sugar phosphate isomerase/epimerase [Planctomycetota bacterium]